MQYNEHKLKVRIEAMQATLKAAIADGRLSPEVAGYVFDKYLEGVGDALKAFGKELPVERDAQIAALDPEFQESLGTRKIRMLAE